MSGPDAHAPTTGAGPAPAGAVDRPTLRRLWPDPDGTPLDQPALATLYGRTPEPHLRVNFVASLDGAVTVDGRSGGLSNAADRQVFAVLRMMCDALVVGAGTLRQEGYRALRLDERRRNWRQERGLAEYPTLVVVSGSLDLDPTQAAFADAPVRPLVLTHLRATPPPGLTEVADLVRVGRATPDRATRDPDEPQPVRDIQIGIDEQLDLVDQVDRVDLAEGLAELHRRGLRQLLCEGGPYLFGALTAADLVDEVCLTMAPLLAGPGAGRITAGTPTAPFGMTLRHVVAGDSTLLLRYARD